MTITKNYLHIILTHFQFFHSFALLISVSLFCSLSNGNNNNLNRKPWNFKKSFNLQSVTMLCKYEQY